MVCQATCRYKNKTISGQNYWRESIVRLYLSAAGMKTHNGLSKIIGIQMRINLSCGDGFMAEHFLYRPQISAAFYQMGRKRMPEGMRTDFLFNTCCFCRLFDDHKNHYPAQPFAPAVEE